MCDIFYELFEPEINEAIKRTKVNVLRKRNEDVEQIERMTQEAVLEIEEKSHQTIKEIEQRSPLIFSNEYSVSQWIEAVIGLMRHGVDDDILYDCFSRDTVDQAKNEYNNSINRGVSV